MMKIIIIWIVYCLLAMSLTSVGEASMFASGDTKGMNNGEYRYYQEIQSSDLIVRGISHDAKSFFNNGTIESSSQILIQEILKQRNTSNVTLGMTIDSYVLGGTVGNKTVCPSDAVPHS